MVPPEDGGLVPPPLPVRFILAIGQPFVRTAIGRSVKVHPPAAAVLGSIHYRTFRTIDLTVRCLSDESIQYTACGGNKEPVKRSG